MRVSMSAMLSLVIGSPRALLNARNLSDAGELTETDAAHAELAHVGTRTAADTAAVMRLRGVPGGPVRLGDQGFLSHRSVLPEGHSEPGEQRTAFCIGTRGGHDAHLQPAKLVDLVVVDLRKHELLAQPEGVIAMPVERFRIDAAEVTNARERDVQQLVEEVEHPPPSQRHFDTDGHSFAQLEGGDRLLCADDDRRLAG